MNSSAPKIGFDRFIQLDWAAAALNVRAGVAGLDDLNALLSMQPSLAWKPRRKHAPC